MRSFLASLFTITPEDGVAVASSASKELERGGLYTICVLLVAVIIVLFVINYRNAEGKQKQIEEKEKQIKESHGLVIQMVERTTAALVEANLNDGKIDTRLENIERILREKS